MIIINATSEGLVLANKALDRLYGGVKLKLKKVLAGEVGYNSVDDFFQAREIKLENFQGICQKLELNWQDIGNWQHLLDLPVSQTENPTLATQDNGQDIDRLVQEVRKKVKTYYEKCYGTLKFLGMYEHIKLESVYTPVSLENYAIRSFEPIDQLEKSFREGNSGRFQSQYKDKQEGITVAKNQQYLMVLGEAGTGKSTFLRKVGLEALKKE